MKLRAVARKIGRLRTLSPRADWVAATRELLLAEVRRQGQTSPAVTDAAVAWGGRSRLWPMVSVLARQPAVGLAGALGLVLATSLTVNAAFYSLPGAPLYRIKIMFERTQLALVSDFARKAELKVEFARNRVKELGQLVSQGGVRQDGGRQVSRAVSRFTQEVVSVHQDLPRLPADRRAVFKLAVSVEQAGSQLADELKAGLTIDQPEVTQAVKEALATVEETSEGALAAAMAAPPAATSSQPLAAAEIQQHLDEKIARLQAKVRQLTPPDGSPSPAVGALQAGLEAAAREVASENFVSALSKISAVRQQLGSIEASPQNAVDEPAEMEGGAGSPDGRGVAPASDGNATSTRTGAAAVGSNGDGAASGPETTQGLISG